MNQVTATNTLYSINLSNEELENLQAKSIKDAKSL